MIALVIQIRIMKYVIVAAIEFKIKYILKTVKR